jgi:hypothetical protein
VREYGPEGGRVPPCPGEWRACLKERKHGNQPTSSLARRSRARM